MEEAERIANKLDLKTAGFVMRVCNNIPLGCADREEDRARQKARRLGLVHVAKNPRRWVAEPLGIAVCSHFQGAKQ